MADPKRHQPRMSPERARRLRRWHLEADRELRNGLPRRMLYLGLDLRIPEGVFSPSGGGPFYPLIRAEARPSDRVLDMGTGCGIGAILAAAQSRDVVGVDVNPIAVEAAAANASRNGVGDRITFRQSDVFDAVDGRFDLILFDPPYRWYKARDLLELSTADENYGVLTRFLGHLRDHLAPGGRAIRRHRLPLCPDRRGRLAERGRRQRGSRERGLDRDLLCVSANPLVDVGGRGCPARLEDDELGLLNRRT